MSYSVYKHTFPNEKVYIGITLQKPEYRWNHGFGYLGLKKNGEYMQPAIANAIQKYGWHNVVSKILYTNLTKEEAEQKEIELIAQYRSNEINFGYNIANGGSSNGVHSEETKRKISESISGDKNPFYGKRHSEETKKRLSENRKGDKHWGYGKPLSEELKNKLSEMKMGENNPNYGKRLSEETRKKMSEAQSGENNGMYGKHHSEETKKRLSKAKSKPVQCIETGIIYDSAKEASKKTGLNRASISQCCNGVRYKTVGGYHWEFVS